MMSPSISGSTIGQVLVKFLNFKHVNNHMIRHSVEQKQNGQHAKPFNRPMSVISFHKMGDFTYIGMYQTTHQYIYLLYWNGFLTSIQGLIGKWNATWEKYKNKRIYLTSLDFFSVFKAAMSLICCPPQPGDESYEIFIQVCSDDLDLS